jgi:hypothetical protein
MNCIHHIIQNYLANISAINYRTKESFTMLDHVGISKAFTLTNPLVAFAGISAMLRLVTLDLSPISSKLK